jgi:hypothetical protein
MAPEILQAAFRIGILILLLAVAMLPFQPPASGAFVATVLSAIVGLLFVGVVTLLARRSAPRLPPAGDKRRTKRLNVAGSDEREGRD